MSNFIVPSDQTTPIMLDADDADTPKWGWPPDFTKLYMPWIDPIQQVGRACGYCIAVHGSLKRDLDMIAVPWIEDATSGAFLAEEVRKLINGTIAPAPYNPGHKPHGREAWSIHFTQFNGDWDRIHAYIDLSVMPRLSKES